MEPRAGSDVPVRQPSRSDKGRSALAVAGFFAAFALVLSYRIVFSPFPSYWDHVPPPYGWGTSPSGWVEDLLGEPVWVRGTYWLWGLWVISPEVVAKGLLILPAFIAPAGFYILARRLTVSPLAAVVGAVYYFLNPAIHSRYLQGHSGMLLGYALSPLFCLAIIRILESKKESLCASVVVAGMTAFIGASLQPHWIPIYYFLVLPAVLAIHVTGERSSLRRSHVVALAAALAFTLLLDLPLLAIVSSTGRQVVNRLYSVAHLEALSSGVPLYNTLRLIGEPAGGLLLGFGYYGSGVRALLTSVPAVFALAAPVLAICRRRASVLVFAWIGLAVLATGVTHFRGVYTWMYDNIPFFSAFRESSKFLLPSALFAAAALSVSLDGVLSRCGKILSYLIIGGIAFSIMVYSQPMLLGDLGIPREMLQQVSPEARALGRWLDRREGFFRVMFIPYDDSAFRMWPLISRRPLFGVDHDRGLASPRAAYFAFSLAGFSGDPEAFADRLAMAGVRYLVVKRRVRELSFRFTSPRATLTPIEVARHVASDRVFRMVFKNDEFWVYENLRFRGFAWLEEGLEKQLGLHCVYGYGQGGSDPSLRVFQVGELAEWVDPGRLDDYLDRRWVSAVAYEWVRAGPYARGETTDSLWYAITRGFARLEVQFDVPDRGDYFVALRGSIEDGKRAPVVTLNGRMLNSLESWPQRSLREVRYGRIHLEPGRVTLTIQNRGSLLALDTVKIGLNELPRGAESRLRERDGGTMRSRWQPTGEKIVAGKFAVHRVLPGVYVVRADAGIVAFSAASSPRWIIIGGRAGALPVVCNDGLLRVGFTSGPRTVIVMNSAAILISLSWVASATNFALGTGFLLLRVFRRKDCPLVRCRS
jgi:hypothetical protein